MRLETFRSFAQSQFIVARASTTSIGLLWTLGLYMASFGLGLLLSPLTVALHLAGFRRLTFNTRRIGHMASEPDCFLKACMLGELPKRRWFFLAPASRTANEHLLSYWTPHIPVIRNRVASRIIAGMTSLGLMRYDTNRYVWSYDRSQEIYRLNAQWGDRPPLLSLTPEDAAERKDMISAIGLPPDAWFVCMHAREPGFAPYDEAVHGYRNSAPEALIPAIRAIVARGGWCVRMGDPTTRPLPSLPGVVDYAHHPLRSARFDVVLCATARFFLGNSSGLAFVSSVFGRPSLLVNVVPMAGLAPWPIDLSVPKLYWSKHEGRLLRFDEILGTPAASYRFASQYQRAGIELRENSPDEILDATTEMLDRLDGRDVWGPDDEQLQQHFMSLLRPGDYGYGAASRVSATFLRKYRYLFPREGVSG